MSLKSSNQISHSLEPGDTICMLDLGRSYDWDQCILVIDRTFKDGWVMGYGSFLTFSDKEIEGPAYNEWQCVGHNHELTPVYMVITHDQRVISAGEGSSIQCNINMEKSENDI